jgi:hypothetical protein
MQMPSTCQPIMATALTSGGLRSLPGRFSRKYCMAPMLGAQRGLRGKCRQRISHSAGLAVLETNPPFLSLSPIPPDPSYRGPAGQSPPLFPSIVLLESPPPLSAYSTRPAPQALIHKTW